MKRNKRIVPEDSFSFGLTSGDVTMMGFERAALFTFILAETLLSL